MSAGRSILLLLVLGALTGCGIEIGNPHGKKGGSGTAPKPSGLVSLSLADATSTIAQNIFLNLTGVSAVPADRDEASEVTLTPAVTGRVDVLALAADTGLALTSEQSITAQEYAGVMLSLDDQSPGSVVAPGQAEEPLAVEDDGRRIFIRHPFEVTEGEELKLTVSMDLQRSITRRDEAGKPRYAFGPVAHLIRAEDQASISGAAPTPTTATVCAYLRLRPDFNGGSFDRLPRRPRPPMPPPQEGLVPTNEVGDEYAPPGGVKSLPPPPPHGGKHHHGPRVGARHPPLFGPDAAIDRDVDPTCPRAFRSAPVQGGRYDLKHLWPGEYELQFFGTDAGQVGDPLHVQLQPGAHVEQ